MFVINKRFDGYYKFAFTNRKGHTLFTGIKSKDKATCEQLIADLKAEITTYTFQQGATPSGKLYFTIYRNEELLGTSRKFSTPLMLQKGIDQTMKYVPLAETLELPDESSIFDETPEITEE